MKIIRIVLGLFFIFIVVAHSAAAQQIKPRIIDGTRVSESDFPSVARLSVSGSLLCTGTLVGSRHILTAAHCFFDGRNRRAVGDSDVVARLNGQEISSQKVTIHPTYRPRSSACVEGETDAALVELTSDIAGSTPIALLSSAVPVGSTVILAGYGTQGQGATGENGTIPPVGQINFGNTIVEGLGDNPPSQNASSSYFYWTFDGGESNTASGDSGGPAFSDTATGRQIAGITCGGGGNAEFGTLSFNTRADLIKSWVESIVGTVPSNTAPGFTGISNLAGTVGQAFSRTISLIGSQPITLSSSVLPPGLTLNGATISGIPTQVGSTRVELTATNAFGQATASFDIIISGFNPNLRVRQALLQFDYEEGAEDFLDLTGTISLGSNFKPNKKLVTVQIGRFSKTFKLRSNGQSAGNGKSYFDLNGAMRGAAFRKSNLQFDLTFERVALFDELATLGFPTSANASRGDPIALPLSVTINGIESSTTILLKFRQSDQRWVISK
jgi:hypothetical protein